MARAGLRLLAIAALIAGCGGEPRSGAGTPTRLELPPGEGSQFVATSGCLACHALGGSGNDGPGSRLDHIGSRLSSAEIRQALVDPEPPMPSYRDLPELDAIVRYLSALR